jgi:hypothetical protein
MHNEKPPNYVFIFLGRGTAHQFPPGIADPN